MRKWFAQRRMTVTTEGPVMVTCVTARDNTVGSTAREVSQLFLLQWRNTECKIIWLLRQYCFNCPTYGYRIRNCIDSTWRCVSALSTTEVTTKPEWNKVCTSHLYELTLMIRSTIPPFVDMPHESLITDEGFLISKFVFLICISSCIMSGISMFSFSNENVVRS